SIFSGKKTDSPIVIPYQPACSAATATGSICSGGHIETLTVNFIRRGASGRGPESIPNRAAAVRPLTRRGATGADSAARVGARPRPPRRGAADPGGGGPCGGGRAPPRRLRAGARRGAAGGARPQPAPSLPPPHLTL